MLRTSMFSDSPGTPGRSAQMPRTTSSTCTPGPAGRVEGVDRLLVDDAVRLDPHARRPAGAGVRGLGADPLDEPGADTVRRHHEVR
jgi:hypothetical protein